MFYYGVDYYPEHWPEERWEIDAELMEAAGINVARLAEFAWVKMEPEEGSYDFSWLDKAIDILGKHGIKTVLGTPTASPPMWLVKRYPQILPVDRDGHVMGPGGRRHYCYNSPEYREFTRKIVIAMAEHYKDNPNVIGWQIDNELGCHESNRCYCDNCLNKFREWLRKKYETLENLNNSWGTIFWSQTYTSWDEIIIPRRTVGAHNPSLLLDFSRFISDSTIEYQNIQVDILRRICPDKFVTHNLMGLFGGLDYYKLAETLDFVSWDNYPKFHDRSIPIQIALSHDVMRGIKNGKTFWVMEEQSGAAGWESFGPHPLPREIRLWAYQAIAHGADAIVYFRWRTCRFGTEQYWHGILDHDGVPRRRYEEVKKMGQEVKNLNEIVGSSYKAETAIVYSYDIRWAFDIQPNNPSFSYMGEILKYYTGLFNQHVPVDIVNPLSDLSKYKLVIAPSLYLMNPQIRENLERYVRSGGTLVVTLRSGVKDWNNVVTEKTLPGELSDLLGIEIEEYYSMAPNEEFHIKGIGPESYTCKTLCEYIRPKSAEIIALYESGPFAGRPVVTINRFGNGEAIYIGAVVDIQYVESLLFWLITRSKVNMMALGPKDVEVTVREGEDGTFVFLLNYSDKPETVRLSFPGSIEEITLEPKYVKIIKR